MYHQYWEKDDVTFRGQYEIDHVAQTITSGTVLIMVMGSSTAYVAETAATIVADEITYKKADLAAGQYRLFFTAILGSGADQRTGIIDFVVRQNEAG